MLIGVAAGIIGTVRAEASIGQASSPGHASPACSDGHFAPSRPSAAPDIAPTRASAHSRGMEPQTVTIADVPAMPDAGVRLLKRRFGQVRCFLEYGAGGSTALAARHGVPKIYSVESDAAYVAAVEAKVAAIGSGSTLHAIYADIGPTGGFGHPRDQSGIERWPAYSAHVWDVMAGAGDTPDMILVDGRFRVACCLRSFMKMSENAILVFDDYFDREERYGIVTRFAPIVKQVNRLALFRKPKDIDLAAMEEVYREYAVKPA
jgi:hypothetical protein